MASSENTYRADIDGLRAFSVCAVLIFHAFPNTLRGGFVGVDVFFVISGYLITGILFKESEDGEIGLLGFYARRIRRIFPALLLVLASCLFIGWSILLPSEFAQLGKHVLASAFFSINIVLWQEIGYFNNAAITKPLLHLWSLGVEEQFYIVWPLFIICIRKCTRSILPWIVLLLLVSFVINIIQTKVDPAGAFFLPFSRGWELLLGAALAALRIENRKRCGHLHALCSLIGGLLLVFSVWRVSEVGFPGWQAALPVLGAGLIIVAGADAPINRFFLSRGPVVYLGKISYPLYLWHWPLLSFARTSTQDTISVHQATTTLAIAFVLAALTHSICERPLRRVRAPGALVASLLGAMAVLALVGASIIRSDGQWSEIASKNRLDLGFDGGWPPSGRNCPFTTDSERKSFTCYQDGPEQPRFALIGDSKAGALLLGLFRTSERGGRWVYFGSGGDGPLLPIQTNDPSYAGYNKSMPAAALKYVAASKGIDTVVIAAAARAFFHINRDDSIVSLPNTVYYQSALDALDNYVRRIIDSGMRVLLVADNPTLPHIEDCVDRMGERWWVRAAFGAGPNKNCSLSFSEHRKRSEPYLRMLSEIRSRHKGQVEIFYSDKLLCDLEKDRCPIFSNEGRPFYGITDHISDFAATLIGSKINQLLSDRRRTAVVMRPLVVDEWGPKYGKIGGPINRQPDGGSALWARLQSEPETNLTVEFSGFSSAAPYVNGTFLAVRIPQALLDVAGDHLVLLHDDFGRTVDLGSIHIDR